MDAHIPWECGTMPLLRSGVSGQCLRVWQGKKVREVGAELLVVSTDDPHKFSGLTALMTFKFAYQS